MSVAHKGSNSDHLQRLPLVAQAVSVQQADGARRLLRQSRQKQQPRRHFRGDAHFGAPAEAGNGHGHVVTGPQVQLFRVFGVEAERSEAAFLQRRAEGSAPATAEDGAGPELPVLLTRSMLRGEYLDRNPHLLRERGYTPLSVNPADAEKLDLRSGDYVTMTVSGVRRRAEVRVTPEVPAGLLLLPGLPEQAAGPLARLELGSLRHERQSLEVI